MNGCALLYRFPTDKAPCAIVGVGDTVLVAMPCGHSAATILTVVADPADREWTHIRCTCCGYHGATLAESLIALPAGWESRMQRDVWGRA